MLEDIGEKDRRILYQFDLDARAPISQVAKQCRLPKHVVRYRMAELERRGIIRKYYAVSDLTCFGFLNFRVAWKFMDAPPEVMKEITEYLSKSGELWWAARVSPFYDVVCAGWAKDVQGVQDFLQRFRMKFGSRIKQESTAFYTYFRHFPKRYLSPKPEKTGAVPCIGGGKRVKPDAIDFRLLSLLSEDARMPFSELAKRAGHSETAVRERVKKLEREGVIIAYRMLPDYEKLGLLYFWAHCRFKDYARMDGIEKAICETPNVVYTDRAVGETGLGIDFVYPSPRELEAYLEGLQKKFPDDIREIEYVTVLDNVKVKYFPEEFAVKE